MATFKNAIILLGLSLTAVKAHAGSPGGLSIAAVGKASGALYTDAIKQFVSDHKAHKVADCNDYMLNVDNVLHEPAAATDR